jgi:hypothetical protein
MSSSMGRIYDDYRDYKDLCKELDVEPLSMRNEERSAKDWYKHYEKLQKDWKKLNKKN